MLDQTLTIILAGGTGSRLKPLTQDRAKPTVIIPYLSRELMPEC